MEASGEIRLFVAYVQIENVGLKLSEHS